MAHGAKNRIKNYVGYVSDYDYEGQIKIEAGDTPISFSPSFMGNSIFGFNYKGFEASFQSQYVSSQYLDNFGIKENSLDSYFVNHLSMAYSFKLPSIKQITLEPPFIISSIQKYETNGYSQTIATYEGNDKTQKPVLVCSIPDFIRWRGTNVLAHITIRF